MTTARRYRLLLTAALLASAPAIVPCAVAQVAVSPAAVEASLAGGESTEIEIVATNEGTTAVNLFAVPLPGEGMPENVGEVLFATEPGEVYYPLGMAMTPEGRLFAADDTGGNGGNRTREYTPELEYLGFFEHPQDNPNEYSVASGVTWMPSEHAPEGHPEGTLWWLDVELDPDGPQIFVGSTLLLEGDLEGNPSGRTVELVTGPGYPPYNRGVPIGLGYDAEQALFYYMDTVNEDIYATDVDGEVAEGYPIPLTDYDDGTPQAFSLYSGFNVTRAADGGTYLEAGLMMQHEEEYTRVVVTDRWGRNTGVETPLALLEPPDGQGEVVQVNGSLRSRLDPSLMYLAVFTQHQSGSTSWIVAIRAHPLPPRWLRVAPVAPLSLEVAPGEADTLVVRLDAEGLAPGVYAGQVALRDGGPNGEEAAAVPVTLTVTEGTDAEGGAEPEAETRLSVYPNPVWGAVTVALTVAEASAVRVVVYDVLGREVAVLHEGPLMAGEHTLDFDAAGLPAGLYLVRSEGGGLTEARRVAVVR